ncbi:hypothetical protein RCL1_001078 [Eukaryota sp. TZLM3-RCL]
MSLTYQDIAVFLADHFSSFPVTSLEFFQECSELNIQCPQLQNCLQNYLKTHDSEINSASKPPSQPPSFLSTTSTTSVSTSFSEQDLEVLSSINNFLHSKGLKLTAMSLAEEVPCAIPESTSSHVITATSTPQFETTQKQPQLDDDFIDKSDQSFMIGSPKNFIGNLKSLDFPFRKYLLDLFLSNTNNLKPFEIFEGFLLFLCSDENFHQSLQSIKTFEDYFDRFFDLIEDPFSLLLNQAKNSPENLKFCYFNSLFILNLSESLYSESIIFLIKESQSNSRQIDDILTLSLSKRAPQESDLIVLDAISRHLSPFLIKFDCSCLLSTFLTFTLSWSRSFNSEQIVPIFSNLFSKFLSLSIDDDYSINLIDNLRVLSEKSFLTTNSTLLDFITTQLIPILIIFLTGSKFDSDWADTCLLLSTNNSVKNSLSINIRKAMKNGALLVKEKLLPFFFINFDCSMEFLTSLLISAARGEDGWSSEDFSAIELLIENLIGSNNVKTLDEIFNCGVSLTRHQDSSVREIGLLLVYTMGSYNSLLQNYSILLLNLVIICFNSDDDSMILFGCRILALTCCSINTYQKSTEVVLGMVSGEILPSRLLRSFLAEFCAVLESISDAESSALIPTLTSCLIVPLFTWILKRKIVDPDPMPTVIHNFLVLCLIAISPYREVFGERISSEIVTIINQISDAKILRSSDVRLTDLKSAYQDVSSNSASKFLRNLKREIQSSKVSKGFKLGKK